MLYQSCLLLEVESGICTIASASDRVTDFMHMDFEIFQTGIFNMADVSIMIGVAWLLVIQFKPQKKAIEKNLNSFAT